MVLFLRVCGCKPMPVAGEAVHVIHPKRWGAWCGLEVSPSGVFPRGAREGANALSNLPDGGCGGKDQVSRWNAKSLSSGGFLTMYEDKTLVCKDCGAEFVFTAGEQEFYAEKGFQNEPTRCKACRAARKASRPAAGAPREMHDAICANCGKPTQVPFVPREDRPVYCSECFAAMHRA